MDAVKSWLARRATVFADALAISLAIGAALVLGLYIWGRP